MSIPLFGGLDQTSPFVIAAELSVIGSLVSIIGAILILIREKVGLYPLMGGVVLQLSTGILLAFVPPYFFPFTVLFVILYSIIIAMTLRGWRSKQKSLSE